MALAVAAALPAGAQDEAPERRAPTRAENRVVEQIMDLHDAIEELLATLPPHLQDAVRERLATRSELARAAQAEAEAVAAAEAAAEASDASDASREPVASPTAASPGAAEGIAAATPTTCNTLWRFDSDRDGMISAVDRYWRHLYLWTDANGDGAVQEDEIESAFERGVRAIAVALDVFERRGKDAGRGEIEVTDVIVLDVAGDGFDGTTEAGIDDGVLMVDAGRIARGDGPALIDETDIPLAGFQAFRRGLRLREANGTDLMLSCP